MTTEVNRPSLYAYAFPASDDPHEIEVVLPPDFVLSDDWRQSTDALTGKRVFARRYPCGLGCKCAAQVAYADTIRA